MAGPIAILAATFGVFKASQSIYRHNPNMPGAGVFGVHKPTPAPPNAPNIDDAESGARQSEDLMRMRRGVLSNIYAGNQDNATPAPTATKTALGT